MFAVSLDCVECLFNCKDCYKGNSKCPNFKDRVDEEELQDLNADIRTANVDLHKFAKDNNLSFKYLTRMLKGKDEMNYKVLYLLNKRLNIKKEWQDFEDRNPSGLCETNRFDEGIFV